MKRFSAARAVAAIASIAHRARVRRVAPALAWIVIASFTLLACFLTTGETPAQCGVVIPTTCPNNAPGSAPSYATDVAPILATYCTSCHAPNGSESNKPLDSYQGVENLSSSVESKISDCSMPPSGNAQPSAEQRDAVIAWVVCGAQNN